MLKCRIKKGPGKGVVRYFRKPVVRSKPVIRGFMLGDRTFYFSFGSKGF